MPEKSAICKVCSRNCRNQQEGEKKRRKKERKAWINAANVENRQRAKPTTELGTPKRTVRTSGKKRSERDSWEQSIRKRISKEF